MARWGASKSTTALCFVLATCSIGAAGCGGGKKHGGASGDGTAGSAGFDAGGAPGDGEAGTGGTSAAGAAGAAPDATPAGCTRDPDLIAEERACTATDQCPCGTHCELGQCQAVCLSDDDCQSDQVCDMFGRCRDQDDPTLVDLSREPEGQLAVDTVSIQVGDTQQQQTIQVRATGLSIPTVRVVAEGAIRVRCGPDGAFAEECTLSDLQVDSVQEVVVEPTAELRLGESGQVRLFAGESQRETVSYTWAAAAQDAIVPGVYLGTAALTAVGTSGDRAVSVPGPSVEVRAEVFGLGDQAARIVLHDELQWLLPTSRLVGDVNPAGDSLSLTVEPFAWFDGWISQMDEVLAYVDRIEVPVATGGVSGHTLYFALPLVIGGAASPAHPAEAIWKVALTWSEDLSDAAITAGPPPLPTGVEVTAVDPTQPLAWEAAAVNALGADWADTLLPAIGARNNIETCKSTERQTQLDKALEQALLFDGTVHEALTQAMPGTDPDFTVAFDPMPASFADSAGTEIIGAIPCHLRFSYPTMASDEDCGAGDLQPQLDDEDMCGVFESLLRCDVVDLQVPVGEQGPLINWRVTANSTVDACSYALDHHGSVQVRKVCRLPKIPYDCTEIALCYDGTTSSTLEETLPTSLPPLSGDLACTGTTRNARVEADGRVGVEGSGQPLTAEAMFDACTTDLGRLTDPVPTVVSGMPSEGLAQLFVTDGCLDVGRRLFAMGTAAELLLDESGWPTPARNQALLHRLVQQWLHTATFLAKESRLREVLGPAVRMSSGGSASSALGASETIELVLGALHPVLHPRIGAALDALPDALLADPDYRARVITNEAVPGNPNHEQPVGLAVAYLEAARALMELVEVRLEGAQYTADLTALEQAGRSFRYALVLRALAESLHDRAAASVGGSALSWEQRYQGAERALGAVLDRALAASGVLHEGRNPLGIEDTDLPLYFMELQGDLSATQRFSAISDFLLGDGLGSSAWAPSFVTAADASLADARAAWLAQQDRGLQTQLTASEQAAEIAQLKTPYAESLQELCGAVAGTTAMQLLDSDDFEPATCYRLTGDEDPGCGLTSAEQAVEDARVLAEVDQQDIDYLFCKADALNDLTGSRSGFWRRSVEVWRLACEAASGLPSLNLCPAGVSPSFALCLDCEPSVSPPNPEQPASPDQLVITAPEDLLLTAEQVSAEMVEDITENCGDPPNRPDPPIDGDVQHRAECFRGALGELALTVQAIAKDVAIARSELEDHQDAYDIVTQGCLIRQLGGQQLLDAQDRHRQTMNDLAEEKRKSLVAAEALDAVATCAEMVSDIEPTNAVFGGIAAGVGCAAATGKAIAMGFAHGYEADMTRAEQDHEVLMMSIENQIADQACFNDAELELVGVRTAGLALQRAAIEMETTLLQFENGKRNALALYHAGRAVEQTVANRTVWPKQYDYWVDQQVETFKARMALAKRFTYLAVLATEYEYQMSITGASGSLRQATLAAQLPGELESVLSELWQTAGTRTIRGNRPTDLKVILSLRDQLLQLADHSELPATELQLTERERFQLLLQSPAYRVFDESGEYLGQRIPFQLAPLAELGLGQSTGVPLYAENDCAERVWSVNASIVGGADSLENPNVDREDLYRGSGQTFLRLDLLKQNTFYSQWCGQPPAELGRFQTASVRPSRNLFRGATDGFEPAEAEEARYSRARIEAYFNVPRADFEADEYANGETSELAARGLYGEYALFVPAGVLSHQQSDGSYTDGLNLDEVDDILLRLDYLSVAR